MKIAVIDEKERGVKWLSGRLPSSWEYVVVREVRELKDHGTADVIIDLSFVPDEGRIRELKQLLPVPVIVNSVVFTLEEIGESFIRINAWEGMLEREVYELAAGDSVLPEELCKHWKYRIVKDVPGMVSGRILAAMINEAYYTLQENVSTKEEIDTAMKLGTNYPWGPFEWSEKIGLKNICDLLNKLSATDSRYLPARGMIEALKSASVAHSD